MVLWFWSLGHTSVVNHLDELGCFLYPILESHLCFRGHHPSKITDLLFYICPHGSQSATFLPTHMAL